MLSLKQRTSNRTWLDRSLLDFFRRSRDYTYFRGSPRKVVIGAGTLGAPKERALLNKPPTAYTVDFLLYTSADGFPHSFTAINKYIIHNNDNGTRR